MRRCPLKHIAVDSMCVPLNVPSVPLTPLLQALHPHASRFLGGLLQAGATKQSGSLKSLPMVHLQFCEGGSTIGGPKQVDNQ